MARNHRSHYFNGDDKPRIEIIPMIDVMMFLMVFFVLIMTEMIQGAGIKLELPQSTSAKVLESVKVNIGVMQDGSLLMNGKPVDEAALMDQLKAMQASQSIDMIISGDKTTPYQNIIKVMDLARGLGILSIGLATQD